MKYFVVTTKHHEGFCLWDTAQTDYKAPNTSAGRDLIRPLVEAMGAQGLRTGFYYSLIDWHHPDFVVDPHIGPLRNAENKAELNEGRDQSRYAAYMREQVRELLTDYGPVDILWFDFSYPKEDGSGKGHADWESERLLEVVRECAPQVIINDRLDLPGVGDVETPEQFQPHQPIVDEAGRPQVWEACQTLCRSWGYFREEKDWRQVDELVRTLIDCVSKNGNLLLNVGPDARGRLDPRQVALLDGIGDWMQLHARSIHGCGAAPAGFETPQDCRYTYNAATGRLYVHLFAWPYRHVHLPGLAGKVRYAQFLHDGSELSIEGLAPWQVNWAERAGFSAEDLILTLPNQSPAVTVPVVELFLS